MPNFDKFHDTAPLRGIAMIYDFSLQLHVSLNPQNKPVDCLECGFCTGATYMWVNTNTLRKFRRYFSQP